MKSLIKHLDPILTTGLVFSIALAIILVILGQDEITSLLVGLVSTTITLTLDTISRLRESEHRVLKSTALGYLLAQDEKLHSTLHNIAESYLAIQKDSIDHFKLRGAGALAECEDILRGLFVLLQMELDKCLS